MTAARPDEIRSLTNQLISAGRVRLPLRELWQLWAVSAPRLRGDPQQAAGLHAALTAITAAGVIELPVGAWDSSTTPPLPRSITVPAARTPAPKRPWTTYPWCPRLGWIASLPTLTEARFRHLVAINDWLVQTSGKSTPVVPMRYRSSELFGNEKELESMLRTNLFGEGRLSLAMLSCTRIPPPLAAARVGDGPDVLVMENSDPYWAATGILKETTTHPVGLVIWGAGRSFPSQIPTLTVDIAGHGPVRGTVWYWGDMDPDGLAIAADASRISIENNGPPIRPAHHLWEAMADHPGQSQNEVDWSNAAAGIDWLGNSLAQRLNKICTSRARVPQEAVPTGVIVEWAALLDNNS